MAQQGSAGRLKPVCETKAGRELKNAKTLWGNADLLSNAQRKAFAHAIIAPKVKNVASVSLVQADKDGNPIPPLLLILSEREKNITLKTVHTALPKSFKDKIVLGRIEQLENWWPDEQDIVLLAGVYTKPERGRKRKQTASAEQSVSSARTASDGSPPRKRTESGSIKLRRKKQPTTKRKRSRIVESSEEEDDGLPAAEDSADNGFGLGTQTKVSAHAKCLAASCTMTALHQ